MQSREYAQDGTGEARHRLADVLSTQSIKAPEVVNGISESMAKRKDGS